jgi:pimeloyl-ACP methyl ester carboxylesterase
VFPVQNPKLSPALLAGIKQPVLVVHGDNDYCFSASEVREESKHFTGSKELAVEIVPSASSSHFVFLVTCC